MKTLMLLSRSPASLKRSLVVDAGAFAVYAVVVFCAVTGLACQALAVLS